MNELDQKINEAIARVIRLCRIANAERCRNAIGVRLEKVTNELRKRKIFSNSPITTAYEELTQAQVDLANLQMQQINENRGIKIELRGH